MTDEFYMNRCIQLALLGAGRVAPNPMVGAVLVHNDRIIGEGYHRLYGKAHAEVNCIDSVAEQDRPLIPDSILYVSLEPCSHFGKTPPCADMIIREHIRDVRIGCIDTTPKVNGKGVQKLSDAGVEVKTGICGQECIQLNKRFFTFNTLHRPYVILKWAQTVNGMVGQQGARLYISNTYTNKQVHQWRSEEASILIGNHTAKQDNPLLTNRYGSGNQPIRIILSGDNAPAGLNMFTAPGTTIVFNTSVAKAVGQVEYVKVDNANYLNDVLSFLYQKKIQSVLVEGGAFTHQRFFDAGLWDECRIITNRKMMISGGVPAANPPEMTLAAEETVMDDLIQYYINNRNPFVASN